MQWTESLIKPVIYDIANAEIARQQGSYRDCSEWLADDGELLTDSLSRYQIASHIAHFFQIKQLADPTLLLQQTNLSFWAEQITRILNMGIKTFVFTTSGTTGQPKQITHAIDELEQEIAVWAKLFAGSERIIRTVPCHHIYGFIWTVLLAKSMNIPVVDARHSLPEQVLENIGKDIIVTIPNMLESWRYFSNPQCANTSLVVSTAPCPFDQLVETKAAGFNEVYQIYGSSETGAVGYRTSSDEHYQLMPYINKQSDQLMRNQQPVAVQDRLTFSNPTHFLVEGRLDNVIQVNGINVDLEVVAKLLKQQPGVKDTHLVAREAKGMKHIAALVIVDDNINHKELQREILQHHELGKVIGTIEFAASLVTNSLGKPIDWATAD